MTSDKAAILDIDGTLVDTNYQHAIAWYRALRRFDVTVPLWRVHRAIGMGGDHLVEHLVDADFEAAKGDDVRDAEKDLYKELIDEVQPMEGAAELVKTLKERGVTVILASSAKEEEVDHYLDLLGIRDVVDDWTTSADVEATKPEPDLVEAAVAKAGGAPSIMVGDSTWDCIAATKAGLRTIAVLTGGFSEQELTEAGASVVLHSVKELTERLGDTPLGGT